MNEGLESSCVSDALWMSVTYRTAIKATLATMLISCNLADIRNPLLKEW